MAVTVGIGRGYVRRSLGRIVLVLRKPCPAVRVDIASAADARAAIVMGSEKPMAEHLLSCLIKTFTKKTNSRGITRGR